MDSICFVIATTKDQIAAVQQMRKEIFVIEQGIPAEMERDGEDDRSVHLLAYHKSEIQPVASGRLTIYGKEGIVSRIAVHQNFRGRSLGRQIVVRLEEIAKTQAVTTLKLQAHAYLENFYTRLGYKTQSSRTKVGRYPLLLMHKELA